MKFYYKFFPNTKCFIILVSLLWPLSTSQDLLSIAQVSMTFLAFYSHTEPLP